MFYNNTASLSYSDSERRTKKYAEMKITRRFAVDLATQSRWLRDQKSKTRYGTLGKSGTPVAISPPIFV